MLVVNSGSESAFLNAKIASYSSPDGAKGLKSRMEAAPEKTAKWVRWILNQVHLFSQKSFTTTQDSLSSEKIQLFLNVLRAANIFVEENMLGDGGVQLQRVLEDAIRAGNGKIAVQMVRDGYPVTVTEQNAARDCNLPNVVEAILHVIVPSKKPLNTLLLWACEEGHIQLADTLIQKGADVDDGYGEPLQLACKSRHSKLACMLIKRGAAVPNSIMDTACKRLTKSTVIQMMRSCGGFSLSMAYEAGRAELLGDLIRHKVDTQKEKISGEMFAYAAGAGLVDIMEWLLSKIPKEERLGYLNGKYGDSSPLIEAIVKKQISATKFLLSRGVDCTLPKKRSLIKAGCSLEVTQPPLFFAARAGLVEIMELILSKIPMEKRLEHLGGNNEKFSVTPLGAALANGHEATAMWLLKAGANVALPGEALYAAAQAGFVDIMELIFSKVPVDERQKLIDGGYSNYEETLLEAALWNKHEAAAMWLLKAGVSYDALKKKREGATPLYAASKAGFEEVVRLILLEIPPEEKENYINRERKFAYHGYLLEMALKERHVDVAKQLIRAGGSIEKMYFGSGTLLESWLNWIVPETDVEFVELILNAASPQRKEQLLTTESLFIALDNNRLDIAQTLMKHGVEVTQGEGTRENSHSPLQCALEKGFEEVVEHILARIPLEKKGRAQQLGVASALVAACKNGHENVALRLISFGVNMFFYRSPGGETALACAREKGLEKVEAEILNTMVTEFEKNALRGKTLTKMLDSCSDSLEFFNVEKIGDVQVCDREIILDDKTSFFVNSKLLAARSEYFKGLYECGFRETGMTQTKLQDVDSPVFEQWLKFQYTGKTEITHGNFKVLADVSNRFLDKKLQEKLRKWLLHHPECSQWKAKLSLL